jgi:hypothetical protein
MQSYVDLSGWLKCAEGHQREIYQSPDDPDVLIKVIKASGRGARGARMPKRKIYWFKRFRRFGAYMTFRREVEEYLEQARKLNGGEIFDLPIARIFGFVHTSNGLGLIVERIANRDGRLSPTLAQVIAAGRLTDAHLALIDRFFDRCRESHLVMMDVNPANFVITDRSGAEEIICIDGTGEKQFFRLYAGSRLLNAAKLYFSRKKLLCKMERWSHCTRDERERQAALAVCPAPN